ncbi:TonB-dependent receptor [Mangrovimonas yunxiaonensis]|uniref:TonB-dependent receptor n=1 Tax=Mangrovimonas yunxiaonensis TaxID=1197477 RepID=A0A084THU3_9FLAO|nr:outer membrane beta-barrel family protein [Mangrovimonas yunxiaonensis]KFB00279.1 TonB-dependent receptor [Mangrovimonas yunxiaonensis]MBR9757699.1 TonB-dependent receptor [Algicola sp.]GGH41450.1 TonB-dependent receptor [Mangrovimonas yunxiaonensis]
MNKLFFTIATVFVSLIGMQAQNNKDVTVTGKIIEKNTNQPLEYATVAFFSKAENRIVTGGITDMDGNFSIPVKSGIYDVSVEFISFNKKTFENQDLSKNTNLGTISLTASTEALDEVEIIAERTTVEVKLDKKIYNVGKDLTVRGGTVSDVLDNVPSVSVDVEGNVALRGQDNVRILINGKPSGLVGLNSTDALRQLPAESIERVEVITSPSARYDAEGTAGILNIILRRSKLQGLNGAITTNVGYPKNAGVSGNINYRTGNFNFFNTTSYNHREAPGNSFTETEYFRDGQPSLFQIEDRDFDRERNSFTTNFGIEWYVTESASLTGSVVYRDSNDDDLTTNTIKEISETAYDQYTRLEFEEEEDTNIQYALNFDKQFNDNSQHKLTADFQYENSTENEFALIKQRNLDSERVVILEDQDQILLQTDYVHPLGEASQFELGYRGNFNTMETDYALEEYRNGSFELNTGVSNNLIYKEHINAVYAQFGSKIKNKFSYLLGLRMENTRITIDQETSGDFGKKNYTGLFPTVNLGYEVSEGQSFTLGYNRRIRRPRSRFINPFPSRSSATSVFHGDPDLDPTYSNIFDLGYLNKFGKLTLNTSVYFQHATDIFNFVSQETDNYYFEEINATVNENDPNFNNLLSQYPDPIPVVRRGPINLASQDRFGLEFTLTYRPTKKWNMNGNFNFFHSKTEGSYNNVIYDNENLSWFVRLNNKYTLPGNIDWQTRLFYMGPREDAQNKSKGMFSTSLAFSKDLFSERASIAFNVNDLFNTRKRQSDTFTDTFNSYSEFQWRERSFNLSFTYRFNQQKQRQRRGENGNGMDMEFEG